MAAIHAVTMPKWGLAMTEGAVAAWTAEEGAEVDRGTEIVDIETSKITNAMEAGAAGVLRRRIAAEGQMLPVGALLGVIAARDVPDAEIDAFVAGFAAEAAAVAEAGPAAPAPVVIEVAGRPIRALEAGEGEGTPILFVHGFGGDLNSWMFNQPLLAEGRAAWAIDLPGHGGSTKEVGEGGIEAMARAVAGFMDAAGIARAHLVGHSMGGAIILALALAEPRRAASLTLVAPAGLGREVDIGYIEGFIAADRRKDIKPHLEKLFGDPALVTRDLIEDVLKLKRVDGVVAALKTIAASTFPGGTQKRSFRGELARIEVPVQVIWGTADRILPAAHAEGLPGAVGVHLIDAKGHMVHMEAAAEVNRLIGEIAAKG